MKEKHQSHTYHMHTIPHQTQITGKTIHTIMGKEKRTLIGNIFSHTRYILYRQLINLIINYYNVTFSIVLLWDIAKEKF